MPRVADERDSCFSSNLLQSPHPLFLNRDGIRKPCGLYVLYVLYRGLQMGLRKTTAKKQLLLCFTVRVWQDGCLVENKDSTQIFQDETEPALQSELWSNLLRAENLAGNYNPVCSDYPIRLLTKRTLGYFTANILEVRGNLPARLGYSASPFSTRRPPC